MSISATTKMEHLVRDERELLRDITAYLIEARLRKERHRSNDWDDHSIANDVAHELVTELDRQRVQVVRMHAVWRPLDE